MAWMVAGGPATLRDFSWWSGLPVSEARLALTAAAARLSSVRHEGRTYWVHEQGAPVEAGTVHRLPCFDELILAYSESRDVLQTPTARFPALGYVDGFRHVVVRDGRLIGHWRVAVERGEMRIETRLSGSVGSADGAALERAAQRYLRFASGVGPNAG